MSANDNDNKWIGQRTIRPDGVDKVTGRATFGADFSAPGMIYGRVLRCRHAHARVKSINVDKALALPGVKAVMTGDDIVTFPVDGPAVNVGLADMRWICRSIMAKDKVLFSGHPVAAVAATSVSIAKKACKLIEVEYEVLPHVINVDEAMKPDAPILHDFIRAPGDTSGKPSNISGRLEHKVGDVEAGFAEADVVIERSFTTEPVHQGYIEPHACLVSISKENKATVWASTQGHFMVRAMTAHLTGLPQSSITSIPAEIGGGFGGKTVVYLEPLALILAQKSGRPVKMTMTREEVFQATGPTSGSSSTVKVGVKKDGTITAISGTFKLQAGSFPGAPIRGAAGCAFAPYDIKNVHSVGIDVVCNRPKATAYRAPGGPIGAYPTECVLDEAAVAIGMDPLQLRLKNAAKEGTVAAYGPTFAKMGYVESLETAMAHDHYKAPLGPNQGRGVASGFWFNAGGESSAQINVNEDGTVVVVTGHPDIGGSRASMMNIAAELLGIHVNKVQALIGDTSSIPFSAVTGGSRATFAAGMVVTQSANELITILRTRAAKIWEIDPEAVVWENGHAKPAGSNAGAFEPLSLAAIAAKASATGGPINARASQTTAGASGGFATHICDVEIDRETGHVKLLRYTSFQDAGRAIHPSYVEGQMQGGVVQGLGWALNEEYIYDKNGALDNASFLDYRIPVASDLPMLEAVVLEIPNDKHPQGIRGVGEVPLVPVMAAVSNAIHGATGLRLQSLPMSPPKVLAALDAATPKMAAE
ncbi:MAG: CO/xanthine dehydrogenase Mo-binding subunit [Hyphomicrobiaceae bacterium]|jgi:CO/xanthine dehydrogenase Mo-binding subunit